MSEVRVVDPKTGGEKGQKPEQIGALPAKALLEVAKVAGFGARKYARNNYLKGYAWSLSYDALQRHLNLFWSGEGNDPESGLLHLAHAAWHCLALIAFSIHELGTDDRWRQPGMGFAQCAATHSEAGRCVQRQGHTTWHVNPEMTWTNGGGGVLTGKACTHAVSGNDPCYVRGCVCPCDCCATTRLVSVSRPCG